MAIGKSRALEQVGSDLRVRMAIPADTVMTEVRLWENAETGTAHPEDSTGEGPA